MKKRNKIILGIAIALCFCFSASTLAYYVNKGLSKDVNATVNTSDTTITVSSYSDLVDKGTGSYNDSSEVSLSTERTTLKLGADITLQSDLVLTRDVHLDLGTHTLNLNNHTLTLKHGYAGCFILSNGIVEAGEDGTGKIVIDLPNAGYQLDTYNNTEADTLKFKKNNVAATSADIITVLNLDAKYTAYSALYLISNAFDTDLHDKPEFKNYATVSAIETLTSDLFINSKTCSYNSDATEACSFVYKDLALENHYLSTDIQITYTSSDETILTSTGKIVKTGNVNLTATISKDGWTDVSVTFPLHVVDLTNAAARKNVGLALIKAFLEKYHVSGDLVIKESTVLKDYYYSFPHALQLPAGALGDYNDLNNDSASDIAPIVFTYSTTNLAGTANANPTIYKDTATNNAYIFGPSTSDYHLVVYIDGEATGTPLNMYSTYVGLDETVAYYITNYLYGGSIIFNKAESTKTLTSLADINGATSGDALYALKQYLAAYNVTAITYALTGKVLEDYTLTNNVLGVASGVIPEDKEESIQMTITINGKNYVIDLNVEYLDSSGSTLASYITYYSIYNAGVPSELETSFEMPFCSNNIAPYTCYDVATYTIERVGTGDTAYTQVNPTLYKPVNMKIELWYDGASKLTFAYGSTPASFTNQLDAHLITAGLTLAQLAAKNGDNRAYYKFSIDAQNSIIENQQIVIIYNYKFENDATWNRYQNAANQLSDNNTTYLTVLGGLFYSTTGKNASGNTVDYAVKDGTFFVWIYNKFRPTVTGYSDIASATTDRIIPTNWLGQAAVINTSDTALKNVTDFSGIKYLSSVTEVDLSGTSGSPSTAVNEKVINGISEMKSLKTLKLSYCNLTTADVQKLSKLSAQGTLKTIDLSNNSIQYFDGITTITSLEKAYVYGNNSDNKYYGSKGICNFQAFADLMRNGCSVYNDTSNNLPILYAESNNLDDYRRLKEIAYQDKLKDGANITNLYDEFVAIGTTITGVSGNSRPGSNPFGLQTAGTLSWGYQGDGTAKEGTKYIEKTVTVGAAVKADTYYEISNGTYSLTNDTTFQSGKTYYVLATATNATYFYVMLTYTTGGYELVVKYYVDRY